jgi:hypothetical protein
MGMNPTADWRFEVYTPVRDPFGPIKYDAHDWSRLAAVLPEFFDRLVAIETHLASGSKQPFVRAVDRLEVMTKRLDALEQQLGQKK